MFIYLQTNHLQKFVFLKLIIMVSVGQRAYYVHLYKTLITTIHQETNTTNRAVPKIWTNVDHNTAIPYIANANSQSP